MDFAARYGNCTMRRRTWTKNDSEYEKGNSMVKGLVLLAAALISGCASTVYEGRYAWRDGWREGVVKAVGTDDDMRRRYAQRCGAEAKQASRFASLRFVERGKARVQTVAVPKDSALQAGDPVYVKVFDCAGQAIPRTAPKTSAP
jgi:hypothetical protein